MSFQRGEVYWADLEPIRGGEIGVKVRPCVIVSINDVNRNTKLVIIVPGTSNTEAKGSPNVVIVPPSTQNGLKMDTAFLCHQTRSIDKLRLQGAAIGRLLRQDFEMIERALAYCTGLMQPR